MESAASHLLAEWRQEVFMERGHRVCHWGRSRNGVVDPLDLKECLDALEWLEYLACLYHLEQGQGVIKIVVS